MVGGGEIIEILDPDNAGSYIFKHSEFVLRKQLPRLSDADRQMN